MSTLYLPAVARDVRIGDPPVVPVPPLQPIVPVLPVLPPALSADEQAIFTLMRAHAGQSRLTLTLDPTLTTVARHRASDMATRNYFSHTDSDGVGPNKLVVDAGYRLPSWYDDSAGGNNIESIASGASAADVWAAWMASDGHRRHLLAQSPFYAAQIMVGVGVVAGLFVVLSAPPSGSP